MKLTWEQAKKQHEKEYQKKLNQYIKARKDEDRIKIRLAKLRDWFEQFEEKQPVDDF